MRRGLGMRATGNHNTLEEKGTSWKVSLAGHPECKKGLVSANISRSSLRMVSKIFGLNNSSPDYREVLNEHINC